MRDFVRLAVWHIATSVLLRFVGRVLHVLVFYGFRCIESGVWRVGCEPLLRSKAFWMRVLFLWASDSLDLFSFVHWLVMFELSFDMCLRLVLATHTTREVTSHAPHLFFYHCSPSTHHTFLFFVLLAAAHFCITPFTCFLAVRSHPVPVSSAAQFHHYDFKEFDLYGFAGLEIYIFMIYAPLPPITSYA